MTVRAELLRLPLDAEQKAQLEAACAISGESLDTFVLTAALDAAAAVLADSRDCVQDEHAWQRFDDALAPPTRDVGGLLDLLRL